MNDYIELNYWQVALASLLLTVNAAISIVLRLRIERLLLLAGARTVLQLIFVGLVLEWVFNLDHWLIVVGLASLMTTIAGFTASSRNPWRYVGMRLNTIISVWASAWIITGVTLLVLGQGDGDWQQARYVIPLLGMVLGNTLNGISLGLSTFTEALAMRREQVESLLALGATRWEAAGDVVQRAVRTGMTPILNAMMVVGIVSLPGVMTGQLLSGVDPAQTVKYQIVIMFMIASATAFGTVGVVFLSFLRLSNSDHQLRSSLLNHRDE